MAEERKFYILRLSMSRTSTVPELHTILEEKALRPYPTKRRNSKSQVCWDSWNDMNRLEFKSGRESRPYVASLVSVDNQESEIETEEKSNLKQINRLVYCMIVFCMDGYFLPVFLQMLHVGTYPLLFCNKFAKKHDDGDHKLSTKNTAVSPDLLYSVLIFMKPPVKHIFDRTGGQLANTLLHERQDVDFALSWLSTLGGAFSSLGEKSTSWALSAGEISLKQLKLAIRLKDPLITSRCKIYWALSLIQRGFLHRARRILLGEYAFFMSLPSGTDNRLGNMIHGVWHKLKYEWSLRIQRKESEKTRTSLPLLPPS